MSVSKRASKLEKERRVFTVQGWIIDGVQDWLILQQMKNEWDLTLRQAKRYLAEAYNRWKANQDVELENKRAAKIAKLQQDIRSLKPEYKGTPAGINAIARIEKMIIKLEDLEPPKRHQVDIPNPIKMTMGDCNVIIEEYNGEKCNQE